jgi:hypothetical protein
MTAVKTSSQLTGDAKLWRYQSLEKFIDLLSTGELFFAPLSFFVKTDPFEGYLPAAAMDALGELSRRHVRDIESFIPLFEDHCKRAQREIASGAREMLQRQLEDLKATPKRFFQAIMQCQTVNCWHANDVESEAMWRLYCHGVWHFSIVSILTTWGAIKGRVDGLDDKGELNSGCPSLVVEGWASGFPTSTGYQCRYYLINNN